MTKSGKFSFYQSAQYLGLTIAIALSSSFAKGGNLETPALSYDWGQWQFATSANYHTATANYTKSGGSYVDLLPGYSYSLAQFDFLTRWVVLPKMGVYASTQFAYAESKDVRDTRRNASFSEAAFGIDYQILASKLWDLYLDFSISMPFQRVDAKSDDVLNHEGSMNMRPSLGFRYWLNNTTLYANTGFIYRDENRSGLIDYAFGAEMNPHNWILGAEVSGFSSLIKDSRNNAFERDIIFAKNGNSLKFYSSDPAILLVKGWIGHSVGKDWQFKVGLSNTITGESYAAGISYFANIIWTPNEFKKTAPSYQEPKKSQPINDFQEDTSDGVDQKIFESVPPASAPPSEPIKRPPPPPKELPKSLAPPTRTGKTKEQLRKELDQTEFHIELKSTKKKKKKSNR